MWVESELDSLLSVAIAELDENGMLLEANTGFLKLIQLDGEISQRVGTCVDRFFIQPNFASLVRMQADSKGKIYTGLLTVGNYEGRSYSLKSRIWRCNTTLHVLAEYDIQELLQLQDMLLQLNNDYAKAQFQLIQLNSKLQQREAEMVALTLTDPLTGVGNRRRLDQELEQEMSRAYRIGDKLCVLMSDLDHFKQINDTYGHEVGDKALKVHVNLLRRHIRPTDIITRFGGEEFVILMPHTDIDAAFAAAERIRLELACYPIEPLLKPVTVSMGIAELTENESAKSLLHRVDMALYQAKTSGRNCVVIACLNQ